MKHILVVDDEIGARQSLQAIFSKQYEVTAVETAEQALHALAEQRIDIVLLDVIMPDKDGLALLKEIQASYPSKPVIMISASTSVRPVVEAIRDGACDYVTKPFDVNEIQRIVRRTLENTLLHRRVKSLESEVAREFPVERIIGEAPVFKKALKNLEKAARTDATILIQGESGTGKELAARLVHAKSNRSDEPFVAVHCAALPENLMESELFGYEKGAFTSADRQKLGRFDLASSGTLFFDEVSEMSPATQVKLLRVLQEHEFMRVGGTRVIHTDARIVVASAKDLQEEVEKGTFRHDLFYRISVVPVHLPPLRDRAGDIPLLARHFLNYFRERLDAVTETFDDETMTILCEYPWPGNIREIRNIIERMVVLHSNEPVIRKDFLPEEFHASRKKHARLSAGSTLEAAVGNFERELIEQALDESNGVQTRAAELLGTTRRILRYRMEKLQISGPAT